MGARDSDDNIQKYLPDLATIRREADPAYAEKKLREALNNPELDAALAELKEELKEGEHPFAFPSVPPVLKAQGGGAASTAGASTQAVAAPPPIEKGMLPSSFAPIVATPVVKPIAPAVVRRTVPSRKRMRLPGWAIAALAVLAVLGPVAMMMIFSKLPAPAPRAAVSAVLPAVSAAAEVAASVRSAAAMPPLPPDADAGAPAVAPTPPVPNTAKKPPPTPVRTATTAPTVAPDIMH
jgi:hypothetical protein